MVVLFQQMVINNWFIVIDVYCNIIGRESEWWIRLFFESFWVIVVLILLNIIIAIVLEVHDSLAMEVSLKFDKINARQQLYRIFVDDDREAMKKKLDEAEKMIKEYKAKIEREEQQLQQNLRTSERNARPGALEPLISAEPREFTRSFTARIGR